MFFSTPSVLNAVLLKPYSAVFALMVAACVVMTREASAQDATPACVALRKPIDPSGYQPVASNRATAAAAGTGLTIIPTFDSTITSNPRSADIQATINAAIAVYKANFSDAVTVNITFSNMSSGLGQSSTYYGTFSYSSYRAALVSHATTADDTAALASLPSGTNNPVNNNASMDISLPLARALGFSANPPTGQSDSDVGLNISLMNILPTDTSSSKYSLFAVASHEIDEALGFGSALNGLNNGAATPTGAVSPEDLFRYAAGGARSFSTSATAAAYFSIDGTTDLARFNQNAGGDFSDWYSPGGQTPEVQDAYATPGATPVLGVELRALDVIGYTRVVATAAQPNLAPATPTGWSAPIVVSKVTGTNTDDSPLSPTDTLYVDFAFGNLNPTATSAAFTTQLLVDGAVVNTVTQPTGLGQSNVTTLDVNIGSLAAGNHTITMNIDTGNTVAESNENDNTFSKTITITAPPVGQPNLTVVTPTGWSGPIVVSKVTGTNTDDSPLLTTDTLYVDFAFANVIPTVPTPAAFTTQLLVDGTVVKTVTQAAGLGAGNVTTLDVNIGTLTAGSHTLTVNVDSGNAITETNESDNAFSRTIAITGTNVGQPNLTNDPKTPVVAPATVSVGSTATFSSGVINNGTAAATSFIVRYRLSTDTTYSASSDTMLGDSAVNALPAGATVVAAISVPIPNVPNGKYYLVWSIDALNQVAESNEADNLFNDAIPITVGSTPTNTPPVIASGPSFTPASPTAGTAVNFTVAATDADNDPLTYAWDFGDGATATAVSPVHTFTTAGTYAVTVMVSDGKGGTVSGKVSVTVGASSKSAVAFRKSFTLNFARGGDSFDIVLFSSDFSNAVKSGQTISILIGNHVLDSGVFSLRGHTSSSTKGAFASSQGTFTFNARSGTLEYALKNGSLKSILAPYGAVNQTIFGTTLSIPIYLQIGNQEYGDTYSFFYFARADKSGKGF